MENIKNKAKINCHCHILDLDFIPKKSVKSLTKLDKSVLSFEPLDLSFYPLKYLPAGPVGYRYIADFISTYKLPIQAVADEYIKKLDEAGIDICVPLMMDLFQSVDSDVLKESNLTPYECQIALVSQMIKKHPWRIFPFVMFDPRRENSDKICIKALEEYGFIGIKMYPALGYHPDPAKNFDGNIANRLDSVYRYCSNNKLGYQVPITTHTSVGGAYFVNLGDRIEHAWTYTAVENWGDPIKKYNLKVNFAHFGGDYFSKYSDNVQRETSSNWREKIKDLMRSINLNNSNDTTPYNARVYADLSYHDFALSYKNNKIPLFSDKKTTEKYFEDLNNLLNDEKYKNYILFGTDASMISHTWTEKEYIEPFNDEKYLSIPHQELIFSTNPVSFLFNNNKIPQNYIDIIPDKVNSLKSWIIPNNDNYYINIPQTILTK